MTLKESAMRIKAQLTSEDLLFALILLGYFGFQMGLISSFHQLPSPLYGGDYYYQLGSVNHLRYGGDIFRSSNTLDGVPGYLPVYGLMVAKFADLFGLESIQAMLYMSQIILVASMLLLYAFMNVMFKDKLLAILGTLAYLPISTFPAVKYATFAYAFMAPLFLFTLYYASRERTFRASALLGVIYGISALTHGVLFILATIYLFISAAYYSILQHISFSALPRISVQKESLMKELPLNLARYGCAFLIGFLISLPYWYEPIFVFHGTQLNNMNVWTVLDFSDMGVQFSYLFDILTGYFFNLSSPFISFFALVGALSLVFAKRLSFEARFIGVSAAAYFVSLFHYFLTEPILGIHLVPTTLQYFGAISFILLVVFGVKVASNAAQLREYGQYLAIGMILLLAYNTVQASKDMQTKDQWINTAKGELPANIVSMKGWILNNTGINDVFLSDYELSFALNSQTGRKTVASRRSHNSPYIDMDMRTADAAILLYGTNDTLREQLLKKYSVKYLYWDYYWLNLEYSFSPDGRVSNPYDPMIVMDTPHYRQLLDANNISYFKQHTWIDPAMRAEGIPQYDLLFILPRNINWQHPWDDTLDKYLEPVWEYTQDGRAVSRIYRIKDPSG